MLEIGPCESSMSLLTNIIPQSGSVLAGTVVVSTTSSSWLFLAQTYSRLVLSLTYFGSLILMLLGDDTSVEHFFFLQWGETPDLVTCFFVFMASVELDDGLPSYK